MPLKTRVPSLLPDVDDVNKAFGPDVHWIAASRSSGLWSASLHAVAVILLLAVALGIATLRPGITSNEWFYRAIACSAGLTLLGVWSIVRTLRDMKLKIGSDGRMLYLIDHRGQTTEFQPDALLIGKNALVLGNKHIQIRNQAGVEFFAVTEIRKYITSVARRATQVNDWEMFAFMVRHGHPYVFTTIAVITLVAVLLAMVRVGA